MLNSKLINKNNEVSSVKVNTQKKIAWQNGGVIEENFANILNFVFSFVLKKGEWLQVEL